MIITLKGATFTKYLDLNSWMIISDLVGVTSSNTATKVDKNSKYETTFTIEEGRTLSEATVTCNGTTYPLTWTDGSATLTIDSVTAPVNITIRATSNQVETPTKLDTPVISLVEV